MEDQEPGRGRVAGTARSRAGWKRYIWPAIGLAAIVVSFWFLARELRGMSWDELWAGFGAISMREWLLIVGCTIGCYTILALYDVLALQHLGRKLNFGFVFSTSLTTYALAHNIGASAFSGAVIRYRAYSSRGLSGIEVGMLVTFCSLTFALGVMLLLGIDFLLTPTLEERFAEFLHPGVITWTAWGLLALIALYVLGSALSLPPLRIRSFVVSYPRLSITLKQLIIAPIELLFAAGILYFALPSDGNPGYWVVMAVFVVAFSLALLSHAPGGLGVFELAVLTALPEFEPEVVLAALLVFRLFYFLIPLIVGLVMIALFEHSLFRSRPAE